MLIGTAIISTTYAFQIAKEQLPDFGGFGMIAIGSLSALLVLGTCRLISRKCLKLMYPKTAF